jgi:hypothetical protein
LFSPYLIIFINHFLWLFNILSVRPLCGTIIAIIIINANKKGDKKMNITIETKSYNKRRMGQPWIAKVDFGTAKGDFAWGNWTGDYYNGGAGVLSIDANPGDIIATGQKDNRQPRNSAPEFFVVTGAGNLASLGDKGAAYKYYLEHKDAAPNLDALRKEKEALLGRIAEIDAILNK